MISRRIRTQKWGTVVLVIANICLLVIYVGAWTKISTQNEKKVIRPLTLAKEPLEIVIEHRGRAVKPNEGFEGNTDWLKNLKFRIRNQSEKVITYIVLDLTFPETRTDKNAREGLHQIRVGNSPDVEPSGLPLYLAPEDSKEISLDAEYSEIRTLVASRVPVESITNVVVRIETVVFDDGTKWFAGSLYRRNPNPLDPHKWIPIDR